MQNEGVKQGKQQNLQQLLNQSLPLSQAMQQQKGRSNSIKQHQNQEIQDHHHHQLSQTNNQYHNGNVNTGQFNQDQMNLTQNINKRLGDTQTNNISNSQIQMMMANYQNTINSPNVSQQNQSQQQLQQQGSTKNQSNVQQNYLQQNYMFGSQKDSSQIISGNNSVSIPFPSSNQSPNNSSTANQHFSLIQFNITQNLKNQKSRGFPSQQQQQYFQIQQQQQQQSNINPQNQIQLQTKKNEKSSQSISANTTANMGSGGNISNFINKGKASLVLQDTSQQGAIQPPRIFSPISSSQNQQQQQQFMNSSQNASNQYQNFINNNFPLLQQQQEQNGQSQQNTPHLSTSAATIMNMMSSTTNNVMPPTNKYTNEINLQKQLQLLQNPSLAAQLQVQQNKVNSSQLGQKVAKAQSIILNKKSLIDKSGFLQTTNNITPSSSGLQSQQEKFNNNGQVLSTPVSHTNSQSQTLNTINLSTNQINTSKQIQANHQYQKSSTTASTQEMLKQSQNQLQQNSHQSSINNTLNHTQVQQLASKIQNINKGKTQQNQQINRSSNNEFQQITSSQQNQQQHLQNNNEKQSIPQSSSIPNIINPISSIENYKTTIEAYKRMVENLNKQLEQTQQNQLLQNKQNQHHHQKASMSGTITVQQNQFSQGIDLTDPTPPLSSNYQAFSSSNFHDYQDDFIDNNPKVNSQLGFRPGESRQSQQRNYEDISAIAAKYSNPNSTLSTTPNNNSNNNNNNNNNINNIKQQNPNNNSYYNNSSNNNHNVITNSHINKSNGDITEMKVPSLRQIDQDDKSGIPSQMNLQSSGVHSYSNTMANIYGSYNQQTNQNQIPPNRNSENLTSKQSLVETPSNSSTQSHLKQSKLGNLLKFQFHNGNELNQNQISQNGLSSGGISTVIAAKKKKSDTIVGLTQPVIPTQSNLRRTPSNSVTQNPLLFGQASSSNLFNTNSPPHPIQQNNQIETTKNPQMSQTAPQHHSFQLNLNKTKQLFSNISPAIESAGGNTNSNINTYNLPQQLQINSAKLDSSNQRNLHTNSYVTGTLETNHFRPSSTMSSSKLKHQNIMTPSKSFSQIFPPPLEPSKISTMRQIYWIFNTPSSFVKAYLLDTKYFADYKQSLNNYVDFVTNIKHPYIFEDTQNKDNKKVKSHKISSILVGLTMSQENDQMKNIRVITENHQNKNYSRWKESMDQKVAQLTQINNNNNNVQSNQNNKINKTDMKLQQQQLTQTTQVKSQIQSNANTLLQKIPKSIPQSQQQQLLQSNNLIQDS